MLPYFEEEYTSREFYINRWRRSFDWPMHLHSHIELIYVRRGAIEVTIGAQTRVMRDGDFAVAFPNSIHEYRKVQECDDADILFYIALPSMTGDYADKICTGIPQAPFVDPEYISQDVFVALEMLKHQKELYQRQVAKAYMQIILACLWPQLQVKQEGDRHRELPHKAIQYLTEHYTEPITLDSMARTLGVTKNHLSRVFSTKLHTRFPQYLHFLRTERAKDLLRHTNKSIIDILYECGYDSPRTFNRVFQSACGITPREYRRRYQEE